MRCSIHLICQRKTCALSVWRLLGGIDRIQEIQWRLFMKNRPTPLSAAFLLSFCALLCPADELVQQSPPSISVDLNDLYMVKRFNGDRSRGCWNDDPNHRCGSTWTHAPFGYLKTPFWASSSINPSTGWIFGSYGLQKKTIDSGATWYPITTGVGAYVSLRAVHLSMLPPAWLVGIDNKIRKTTTEVATWNVQYTVTASMFSHRRCVLQQCKRWACDRVLDGKRRKYFGQPMGGLTWTSVDMGNSWFNRVVL